MSKHNDASQYQLPKNVVPRHYKIVERPSLETFLFTGSGSITLDVLKPTSQIVMHARELKVTDAYVVDSHGTRLNAIKTRATVTFIDPTTGEEHKDEHESAATLDHKAQTATFNFNGELSQGEWTLVTEHEGSLVQPSFEGFHRCGYKDDAGNQKWALSTQFEATHARRAFVCNDEPDRKATYDVTIETNADLEVLSNSRKLAKSEETIVDGKKIVRFATTAKQSTYLLAWSIGEFESSDPVFVNGKEIRIWSVKGKKHLMSYALKVAAFGVKWFEKKLGVAYFGGDKIDLIAIPEFRSGAMENTGLITFRATALLVDEAHATIAELQRVAEVVLHELAHQWFGNLVTMVWWDGLPLNESNATVFAYFALNDFEPEWHIYDSFGLNRAMAFSLDSLKSTHACWGPVGHPDEVEQRFDAITYEKGGSLEFQIHQFTGPDLFYKGCNIYLNRFNHGNAEVTDLWDALEEGARSGGLNVPVREIMDSWFLQDGHPVVTVTESDKPGFIKLHQERFAFLGDESHASQLWPIPMHLRYATADGTVCEEKFIFSGREQEVFVDKGFKWVVANAGGTGFFRVRYSQTMLDKLTATPFDTLKVIERFNLVNDSWALVRAQKLSSDTYLGLVQKLAGENNPNVWSIVSGSLSALHSLTSGDHRAAMKKLIRDLVKPVFSQLGWAPKQGESSATLELRGSLASLLGTIGEDPEVQAKAAELFGSWKADRNSVDPNVVPSLVSTLAYTGDKTRFDEFVALSKAAKTDQEKLRFLGALGRFRTPELYAAAIAMTLTEVKTDDAPYILGAFLGMEHSGETAWDAMRENWEKIVKRFPSSGTVRMIGGCSALDTDELQAEVVAFFAANKVAQGDMAVAQMLERLSVNVRLRATESARLAAHLIPVRPDCVGSPEPAATK